MNRKATLYEGKIELDKSNTDSFSMQWEIMFCGLIDFYNTHGHCNVPKAHVSKNGLRLGLWTIKQRFDFEAGLLDDIKIKRLESIEFTF